MSASENVETAKKAYEAFSVGDLETATIADTAMTERVYGKK